jgi:N-acetyl-anhydromuramyl-L-alanine amidase AmpD
MRLRPVLLALLLLPLSGCDSIGGWLPWGPRQPQSSAPGPGGVKTPTEADPGPPPLLLEPVPSGLKAESAAAVARCRRLLGLPAERRTPAHETNYGTRTDRDVWGRRLIATPQVIVLHETVLGEPDTVALFSTAHPRDQDQVSYHMLVGRDGALLRIVPDDKRAYGSGMSAFGDVTQRTKPGQVGSINNIALHISLITPPDGRDDRDAHSGYSEQQYRSLAGQVLLWQGAHGIPLTRLTTHAAVDRSHSRYDPRSFRWDRFDLFYQEAAERCGWQRFNNQQAGL